MNNTITIEVCIDVIKITKQLYPLNIIYYYILNNNLCKYYFIIVDGEILIFRSQCLQLV